MGKPWAVLTLALVQGFISIISLVSGAFLVLLMTGHAQIFSADLTHLSGYFKGLILSGLGISLVGVVATYGLWRVQRWGWIASVLFQLLCLLNNGLALLGGQSFSVGVYFSVGICGLMLAALMLPTVRQTFSIMTSAELLP